MTIKIQGDKITFPDDSEQTTAYDGSSGGGIPEAPVDGKQYGRQDANWTEVTGGGGDSPSPVSFQAYCSTDAQVFAGDVTAQVGFDVFEWDTNSGFDSATSSYTPNVAGYYQVNASVAQQSENMLRGNTSIWKNDSVVAYASNLSETGMKTNSPVNTVVYCNGVDDKLYVKFNPAMSGGGLTSQINSSSLGTYFNATLMQGVSGSGGGGGDATPPVTFRSGSINTGQTPPVGADFKIAFGTPATSEGGTFDGTYFTPNTEGWYQTSGSVFISATDTTRVGCLIQKNGSSQLGSFTQGTSILGGGSSSTSGLVYCNGTTDKLSLAIVCSEAVSALGGTPNTIWFSASLSTGGSSSGGGTTDILPVLYSGVVNADGTVKEGTGFTSTKTTTGKYLVTLDKPVSESSSINCNANLDKGFVGYVINSSTEIEFNTLNAGSGGSIVLDREFSFTVTGTETIAVGGGSGGSYTPEKMVWKDETGIKVGNTDYTNTNDVPIYLDVTMTSAADTGWRKADLYIDGVFIKTCAKGPYTVVDASQNDIRSLSFIVPSGSVYRINSTSSSIQKWWEARMPVAIGTGGTTTPLLLSGITPDDTPNFSIASYTKLANGEMTVDVVKDKKYIITGGSQITVNNTVGSNTVGYWKVVLDNTDDTPINTFVASTTGSGGVGTYTPIERSFIYIATETKSLVISAYVKVGGASASAGFKDNKVRIQEVAETTGGSGDSIWTDVDGDAVLEDGFVKVKRNSQEININPSYGGAGGNAIIESNDPIGLMSNSNLGLTVGTDGQVYINTSLTVNGQAFNIADLPSLPDAVLATDEVRVQRDGVDYKTTADKL